LIGNRVTSTAVLYEIGLISDPTRRSHALRLIQRAHDTIRVDDRLLSRAEEFENLGIMGMDAVHIACAEKAGAVLLTTDDDLVKIMKKNALGTSVHADNPLRWLMEVNQHGK
jgi:predicted nucleic acid-binding protein